MDLDAKLDLIPLIYFLSVRFLIMARNHTICAIKKNPRAVVARRNAIVRKLAMLNFAVDHTPVSLKVTNGSCRSVLDLVTILSPNATAKETSTAQFHLMLLLLQFLIVLLMPVVRW